jgi:hypothetical protein
LQPALAAPYLLAPTGHYPEAEKDMGGEMVPIVLFGCIAYVIKLLIEARMRIHLLRSGGSEELLRSILENEITQRRHASLRSGITLLMIAAGFALVQARGWLEINPGTIAVLAGAVGVGNLAYYVVAQRWR